MADTKNTPPKGAADQVVATPYQPIEDVIPDKAADTDSGKIAASLKAQAEAREAMAKIETHPPVPLGRPAEDVIGRELDWSDIDKARAQQREATAIRDARVQEDVARVNRGLAPKYATK